MQKIKTGAKEAGRGLKQEAGVVAEKAGEKLQEVGKNVQQDAARSTTSGGHR
jgi:hypothetical protein